MPLTLKNFTPKLPPFAHGEGVASVYLSVRADGTASIDERPLDGATLR